MFDSPGPGLTIHLRYMHYDLDPSSTTYLKHHQREGDTLIKKGDYSLGSQRLPRSREGRHAFLWAPFDAMGKCAWRVQVDGDEKDKTTAIVAVLLHKMKEYIHRTEEMMLAAGDIFYPMPAEMSDSSEENPTDSNLIYESPAWQESTSVYFQLACRLPYIRQLQALFGIWDTTILRKVDRTDQIEKALKNLRYHLIAQPDDSLSVSITVARWYKTRGDIMARQPNGGAKAIAMYIRAITRLLPYFPSEYYMDPWEMRVCELGTLYAKCNLNIAHILIDKCTLLHSAWELLEVAFHLPCLTNWETAKVIHLQGRCVQSFGRLASNGNLPSPHSTRSHPGGLDPSNFFKARDKCLLLPRSELALQRSHLFDGFEPEDFLHDFVDFESNHHILAQGVLKEERWYEREDTEEAGNVKAWLGRMAYTLQQIHDELLASKEGGNSSGDLEADNTRLELTEGKKVVWEYRVEIPEEGD